MPIQVTPVVTHPISSLSTLPVPQEAPSVSGTRVIHVPINSANVNSDPNIDREPDYYLYVVVIAKARHERDAFVVRRPPLYPCLSLRKCPPEEPYIVACKIPNIVNEKYCTATDDARELRNRGYRGERVAQDIVNPSNLGEDVWADIDERDLWLDGGGSDDLTRRGVFWTRNEVPTKEELDKARARMERHYRKLISEAEQMYVQNRSQEIGEPHHVAAEYFRVRSPWHLAATLPESCPNCGEEIRHGVAFHQASFGLCVLPDGWKRAVEAGVKTKNDVPEGSRWWAPEKSKTS